VNYLMDESEELDAVLKDRDRGENDGDNVAGSK
jgi:hypothetical protein